MRRALRATVHSSELTAGAIRRFLLAEVLAYLFQLEPDRGHRVAADPEVFAREVPLLSAQSCDRNGTLSFQKPHHGRHRVLRRDGDAHMHRVRHEMPFHNLAFLLLRQGVENRSPLLA